MVARNLDDPVLRAAIEAALDSPNPAVRLRVGYVPLGDEPCRVPGHLLGELASLVCSLVYPRAEESDRDRSVAHRLNRLAGDAEFHHQRRQRPEVGLVQPPAPGFEPV